MVLARPLLPIDETRYLDVAWEMRLSGDWLHLSRNFETYTHKPPLLFWLVNLVWLVTGVSELAARLVGPACALGVVAGTAALARRLWPGDAGAPLRAAAVLAAFPVFLIYGSATMFDALLTLAVLLGMAALWRIGSGGTAGRRDWVLLGAAFALGTYAKGPVILVHLLPVLLLIRLWAPAPPAPRALLRGTGLAIATGLALVALWLVPVLVTGDAAFRHELLWTQSAARVGGGLAHDRPPWFLAALLPLLLFPWAWSWRLWRGFGAALAADRAARFAAVWALSGLVLFSLISGKQAHYLVPEFPAAALLFARLLAAPGKTAPGGSLAPVVALAVAAVLIAAGLGVVPLEGDLADLVPAWPALAAGAALAAAALAALRLPALAAHLVTGMGLALALHAVIPMTALHATHDSHVLVDLLAPHDGRGIAVVGMPYNAEFNFAARLREKVATPADAAALADWARAHPGGIVTGPVATAGIAAPPAARLRYNRRDMGVWPAAAVIAPE